jgi:hypothetical protein
MKFLDDLGKIMWFLNELKTIENWCSWMCSMMFLLMWSMWNEHGNEWETATRPLGSIQLVSPAGIVRGGAILNGTHQSKPSMVFRCGAHQCGKLRWLTTCTNMTRVY